MEDKPPAIRRLCVAYGVESSGGFAKEEKVAVERRGTEAFTGVCVSLGLGRMLLNYNETGQSGVFPVGIDEPRVVSSLVDGLVRAAASLGIRFRLAFHEGVTTLAAGGFGGTAIATVRRLADSPQLRAALARDPRACLAVMMSGPVFVEIDPALPAHRFQQVEVAHPDQGPGDIAWMSVLDRP
jgi:hypothetical protein